MLRITEQNQTELLMHGLKILNKKYTFISIITETTKIHKHFSPSLAQHGLCYKQNNMEVVEWSVRLARKRALRVRCLLAPLSMMHILLQTKQQDFYCIPVFVDKQHKQA